MCHLVILVSSRHSSYFPKVGDGCTCNKTHTLSPYPLLCVCDCVSLPFPPECTAAAHVLRVFYSLASCPNICIKFIALVACTMYKAHVAFKVNTHGGIGAAGMLISHTLCASLQLHSTASNRHLIHMPSTPILQV